MSIDEKKHYGVTKTKKADKMQNISKTLHYKYFTSLPFAAYNGLANE
jgi:hypothetical protein